MTAAERLAKAEADYAAAKVAADRADARADRYTIDDPGALSGIRRKPNRSADDRRFNSYSAAATAHETLRRTERQLAYARDEAERSRRDAATRATVTPERVKAATHIRTRWGWERVVRVSAKSVTVEANWPMDARRVSLTDVLEARP